MGCIVPHQPVVLTEHRRGRAVYSGDVERMGFRAQIGYISVDCDMGGGIDRLGEWIGGYFDRGGYGEIKMEYKPARFIGEMIEVRFERPPKLEKVPDCPNGFVWNGENYQILESLNEWHDYSRQGRMERNMRPSHAALAARRGSWGVGRDYFRVRTDTDQVFELYYDRSPSRGKSRKGGWFLFQEMEEA